MRCAAFSRKSARGLGGTGDLRDGRYSLGVPRGMDKGSVRVLGRGGKEPTKRLPGEGPGSRFQSACFASSYGTKGSTYGVVRQGVYVVKNEAPSPPGPYGPAASPHQLSVASALAEVSAFHTP